MLRDGRCGAAARGIFCSQALRRTTTMRKADLRSHRRLLDDFFKVDEVEVSFERFDGSMTPPVRRLAFERGDSAAGGGVGPRGEGVLPTAQIRFSTFWKGPWRA